MDSTTGVQMAYLKQWAPGPAQPLVLRVPELRRPGPGRPGRRLRPGRLGRSPSTWPISTRPTTSTATTPTTTCGRPSWPGTPPPSTAWPASARTCGTRSPRRLQLRGGPCPTPCPGWWPGWPPTSSSSPTTTRRGSTFDELRRAVRRAGPRRGPGLRLGPLRGARIGIHDPPVARWGPSPISGTPSMSWSAGTGPVCGRWSGPWWPPGLGTRVRAGRWTASTRASRPV